VVRCRIPDRGRRYKLTRTINPVHFFPALDDSVAAYRAETGEDWERGTHPASGP
jgi:hypothetical protein